MPCAERVTVFDWTTEEYHTALELFLANTDQKENAKQQISEIIAGLSERCLFVDAGAGSGEVTLKYADRFDETVAVEPNESLYDELVRRVGEHAGSRVLARKCPILDPQLADLTGRADFVLCSHVLYYVPEHEVMRNVERLAAWLAPRGVLAIVLQNPASDVVRMVNHFSGRPYGLSLKRCRDSFDAAHGSDFTSRVETGAASVTTADEETANAVAAWMLVVMSQFAPNEAEATDAVPPAPERHVLAQYVRDNFATPERGYRFSCDQDFLLIERRANG